ncbi:MAG: DUF4410 domain-containing protein [Verrucomicrobia bacterium]|nr:DUF4410 domain-containing protein [Verrucomicrobiota bacterium]
MNAPETSTQTRPRPCVTAATAEPPFGRRIAAALLATSLCYLVAGCQSISNSKAVEADNPPNASLVANPRPVMVCDFAFDVAHLRTEEGLLPGREGPVRRVATNLRSGETPAQRAARLAGMLSEAIADELATLKIPATRQPKDSPWPASGLVVCGEFLEVDEGNRLRRAVIGFGAGASEVLTQVEVFDLARNRERPILVYGTGTGSRPTPGGVVSMNPYAMAAKYVLSRGATEKEVRNLGKQIARDLARVEVGSAGSH